MFKRVVDNDIYLPVLRELINEGRDVRLNVRGNSMMPFFVDGRDSLIISKINSELKKGDIVIFQRKTGEYILHRVFRVDKAANQYYIVGDAQTAIEGPIDKEQIFGIITKVCRKGKWVEPGDKCWWFYEKIWILFRPFRARLLLLLLRVRGLIKRV